MIVTLKIEQEDLLAGTCAVLADGKAIHSGTVLSFQEKEPFSGKGRLEIREDGVRLFHCGDTESETVLFFEKEGYSMVFSPFGEMRFQTRLLRKKIKEGEICLEYQITEEDSPVGWFCLRAVFEPLL